MDERHIIIFSHGFGVRKDARGLFTAIAKQLISTSNFTADDLIMFDYNQVDEATNTLTATTLDKQAQQLLDVIAEEQLEDKEVTIDVICHSQGCIVAALAQPHLIRKIIFLAPPDDRFGFGRIQEKIQALLARPGTVQSADGTLRYPRRDGSTTIIPPAYWQSRQGVAAIKLYKQLAAKTKLIIFQATHDEVIGETDFSELPKTVRVLPIDSGHDFEDKSRQKIADLIAQEINS